MPNNPCEHLSLIAVNESVDGIGGKILVIRCKVCGQAINLLPDLRTLKEEVSSIKRTVDNIQSRIP